MHTFNRLLFTAMLLACACGMKAQDDQNPNEGTGLQAYLEYCLYQREAMARKSTQQLRECIEESTQSDFRFNDVPIRMNNISDDIEEVDVPKGNKVEMYFTPDYVDELLMHDTDYRDEELEGPALMRDTELEVPNCMYTHQALDVDQSGTYRIECSGRTRLICVPDPNGLVSVTVTSESGTDQPFKLEDKATPDTPYTDCAWNMTSTGTVLIKVTNLSKQKVSFVLAMD